MGSARASGWCSLYCSSIAYVLGVYFLCLGYSRKLVGPQIAFRRHIAAIESGDYSSRIVLRKGDAFDDVAHP